MNQEQLQPITTNKTAAVAENNVGRSSEMEPKWHYTVVISVAGGTVESGVSDHLQLQCQTHAESHC